MEENQNASLFGLGIDPAAKAHLSEAARWAKFLSIVGFVIIGLIVIVGIFFGSLIGSMSGSLNREVGGISSASGGIMGSFFVVFYILFAAIYFFPCLFLYHFATKMKTALAADDQGALNVSFQNLKKMFRFIGILTVIVLALYAIIICAAVLGAGLGR